RRQILRDVSLSVLRAYPGDTLALLVRGDVGDFVGEIHVPVDACDWARRWASAADVDEHPRLPESVLLVVGVMDEGSQLLAVELFRPVAMRARLLCGGHVVNGRGNRSRIVVEDDAEELAHAREFRADVAARPWPDVAIH